MSGHKTVAGLCASKNSFSSRRAFLYSAESFAAKTDTIE